MPFFSTARSLLRQPVGPMLLAGALLFPVLANDALYIGTWKIASAVEAPWTGADPPDPAEMKALVGKNLVFKASEITGPRIMTCRGPNYRVVDIPAEGLFQGAFDEMHTRDKSVDPLKLAAKVGFQGSHWKSLQTGCSNELDFHFVDSSTAEFGLDDWVFTIKKQ